MSDTYSGGGNPTPAAADQTQGLQGPPPTQSPGLMDRWNTWIDKPGNRAAMMQFGIAMLQPMQQGESFLGHSANALGYAGEAENRVEQQRQQGEQRESQEALRSSQANLAEARAGTAGANAQTQLERLQHQQQLGGLNALVRLQPAYGKEKADWELTHDPTKEPFMDFGTWMDSRGIDPRMGGGAPSEQPTSSRPQTQSTLPLARDALSKPSYRPAFDALRSLPKPEVKARLDRFLQIHPVQDPQTLYKEFGVQ